MTPSRRRWCRPRPHRCGNFRRGCARFACIWVIRVCPYSQCIRSPLFTFVPGFVRGMYVLGCPLERLMCLFRVELLGTRINYQGARKYMTLLTVRPSATLPSSTAPSTSCARCKAQWPCMSTPVHASRTPCMSSPRVRPTSRPQLSALALVNSSVRNHRAIHPLPTKRSAQRCLCTATSPGAAMDPTATWFRFAVLLCLALANASVAFASNLVRRASPCRPCREDCCARRKLTASGREGGCVSVCLREQ